MTTRRAFIFKVIPAAAGAVLLANRAFAAEAVRESDPMAEQLGYKNDTNDVNKNTYPKHSTAQKCSNCSLYQANGTCTLFAGKTVAANGWCASWAKKA